MAGLYFHIPFCRKACHYCDFHFSTQLASLDRMVLAMTKELTLRSNELSSPINTVYFGGGTPSLLNTKDLEALMAGVHNSYLLSPDVEFTLEANPEDITIASLTNWKSLGINRLSIGLQGLNDEELQWMNRIHDSQRSINAVKMAMDQGFRNITVDLIYGSKFQTLTSWINTIKTVVELGVPHISAYNLTVEQGTALGVKVKRGQEPEVDETLSSELFLALMEELAVQGYEHYEISNFALPGYRSRHNANYWKGESYIGIGPSAHSFNGQIRRWNVRNNPAYMKAIEEGNPFYEEEIIDNRTAYNEYVMTGLRTIEGCDLNLMQERFGTTLTSYFKKEIQRYNGFYTEVENHVSLTKNGRLLADRIASDLFFLDKPVN